MAIVLSEETSVVFWNKGDDLPSSTADINSCKYEHFC